MALLVYHEPHLIKHNSAPLILDGKPSQTVEAALEFCRAYNQALRQTELFADYLATTDLLAEQDGRLRLDDGGQVNVRGLRVLNATKLDAASDDRIVEWIRKGAAATAVLQAVSMQTWGDLVRRRTLRELDKARKLPESSGLFLGDFPG